MAESYDFSGWATRNNVRCSDGRTIMQDAFKDNDGQKVPLVWNHRHDDPLTVLGHALLENRPEGVYAYCTFNNTESGRSAKELVQHGDITSLSIYANKLKQNGGNVVHGMIREVSLVLAGANPKALIANVVQHGEELDDEAQIYFDEPLSLQHAEQPVEPEKTIKKEDIKEESEMANVQKPESEETIGDVFNTLTEKQKKVVYAIIGYALDEKNSKGNTETDNEEDEEVKHNVFDSYDDGEDVISHSDLQEVLKDGKRFGSLRDSAIQHGMEDLTYLAHDGATYGVDPVDYLYPDARNITNTPQMIARDTGWVNEVMKSVHHTPFSRVKGLYANITADEARARGYVKGHKKVEEVITLLKRSTTPTTVYKKQKMDRDDVIDITDFDVVAWLKGEMRGMLEEEIARAILVGDGRSSSSDDKINEMNIRPIWTDDDLFTIKVAVTAGNTDDDTAKEVIRQIIKSRKDYKGSGNPVFFTTEDMLTDMLLIQDAMGRDIYDTEEKLRTKLRVSKIVTVPVMENLTRTDSSGVVHTLGGLIVNLADYNVGADKGGAINMFDDFDIDYNQEKYLIETRCSGAMTKPYSAMAIEIVPPKSVN